MQFFKFMFGTKYQRDIRKLKPLVDRINSLEEEYQSLSVEALQAKTPEFRERIASGEALDDVLCEAFAVVKNACRRLCGTSRDVCGHDLGWEMVPFDVQLIGGIVLHQGKIAEMATGEGKTLVATMPAYLNGLAGNVHIVTVNDYLAQRDAQWMGAVYEFLGLSVGCIQNSMSPSDRRKQYSCDITYGTNSEFGFDYLRDNGMAVHPESVVQRGHSYAIIDEVDSILVDEARTPLIISGPAATSSHQFFELKPRVEHLVRQQQQLCNSLMQEVKVHLEAEQFDDAQMKMYQVYHGMPKHKQFLHLLENPEYRKLHEQVENIMLTDMRKEQARSLREELLFTIDERSREVALTDNGCNAIDPSDPETFLVPDIITAMADIDADESLDEAERNQQRQEVQIGFADRNEKIHNVDQLIRAYCMYERDVEYVVQENRVLIVDEYTGRVLPGRRWGDGLHQAVEAKEAVQIERETQTLATITIQNYFRLYAKLAGMTGTAETEASEFHEIYNLDVVVIPTNRPVRRVDLNDLIFKTQREKFRAVMEDVSERHKRGQPVLVGTANVDTSEVLSRMLRRAKIPHSVLNAKNHAREAEIVMRAGQPGAVTIATNMAGRGTDIKLGEGVIWTDRATIESQVALDDDMPEGPKTLRELLIERPCGLHVVGSERHESRRIDRQLRGRCARQGDPGSSQFYISLEDTLMRLFGSDRIAGIMVKLGMQEGEALEHRWLNRSVETAQRRVEQQNFAMRKRTLDYDDVMNMQRETVYTLRGDIVRSEGVREFILDVFHDLAISQSENMLMEKDADVGDMLEWVHQVFPITVKKEELMSLRGKPEESAKLIFERVERAYSFKISMENQSVVEEMERQVVLHVIDTQWQDYLRGMDELRRGVGLRAFGQRDPLVEYKREASGMFEELMSNIKIELVTTVFRASTMVDSLGPLGANVNGGGGMNLSDVTMVGPGDTPGALGLPGAGQPIPDDPAFANALDAAAPQLRPERRDLPKVGRNDPCSCGSGKKFKKCCGK